ncbi:exonuclease domain-containing protein [Gemmatimonadota bacterium]
MSHYSVFDLETTGFSAAHHHRVLEIAVVIVDDDGCIVDEWDTVLNPERDVGATEIHGLSAADVYGAPTFNQIAGELITLLDGKVPVAHNLSFDAPFLSAEFERMGYSVPLSRISGLCTMRLASRYLSSGPRTLAACCNSIGYEIESAHAALDDARAAACLLAHYIESDPDFLSTWDDVISAAQRASWPEITSSSVPRVPRTQAIALNAEHFLARLAAGTPRSEIHPDANSYFTLLDRVLLDRYLSHHEQDELVSVAEMMGLSREEVENLHRIYMNALGRIALDDGVITTEERADLDSAAKLLGLNTEEVDMALSNQNYPPFDISDIGEFKLEPGDAVVFTGDASGVQREDLEYQARSLGYRVTSSVSGKTQLLVAADPDSISSKARKARDLSIPIVDYQTYFQILDSMQ